MEAMDEMVGNDDLIDAGCEQGEQRAAEDALEPAAIGGVVVTDDEDDDWAAPVIKTREDPQKYRQGSSEACAATINLTENTSFKRVTRRRTIEKGPLRQTTLSAKQAIAEKSIPKMGTPQGDKAIEQRMLEAGLTLAGITLKCPTCKKAGAMVRNGTTRAGAQAMRCTSCRKQVSGQNVVDMLTEQRGATWKLEALDYVQKTDRFAGMTNGNCTVSNPNAASNNIRGSTVDATNQQTVTVPKAAWEILMDQVTILATAVDSLRKEKSSSHTTDRNAEIEENRGLREELNALKKDCANMRMELQRHNKRTSTPAVTQTPEETPAEEIQIVENMEVEVADQPTPALEETTTPPKVQNEKSNTALTAARAVRPAPRKWSQVAGEYRPLKEQSAGQHQNSRIPDGKGVTWAERLAKSREMLTRNNLRVEQKPQPVAVYFKGIRRGPLGQVRAALRQSLANWALLDLSFIGSSVLEIITDKAQRVRLVETLKHLGLHEIKDFDMIGGAMKARRHGESEEEMAKKNTEKAIARMQHCMTTTRSQAARNWYKETIQVAKNKMTQFNTTDGEVASGNATASNKAKDQSTESGSQVEATADTENTNENRNNNAIEIADRPQNDTNAEKDVDGNSPEPTGNTQASASVPKTSTTEKLPATGTDDDDLTMGEKNNERIIGNHCQSQSLVTSKRDSNPQ